MTSATAVLNRGSYLQPIRKEVTLMKYAKPELHELGLSEDLVLGYPTTGGEPGSGRFLGGQPPTWDLDADES